MTRDTWYLPWNRTGIVIAEPIGERGLTYQLTQFQRARLEANGASQGRRKVQELLHKGNRDTRVPNEEPTLTWLWDHRSNHHNILRWKRVRCVDVSMDAYGV